MADVTVDQKPMEKLPYDPADIPDAVRKRAAAVDALYTGSNGGEPQSAAPEPQPPPETPAPQAPPQPVQPSQSPASSAPADSTDVNADSWKHRYLAMQGRYNATQKTIGEMQEQMMQLGNELMHAQQAPQARRQQQAPQQAYLTEQDVENYGPELISVTQRAALQAVEPKLREVEQQNVELRKKLAVEARRRLDQAVELAVPDYRDIDRNPRWHRWLLGIDVLSGRVRQQLLNEAIASGSAPRVISFFRGFQQEETATGHIEPAPSSQPAAPPREPAIPLASLAAPGRARPATGGDTSFPPDKPIYTRAQVAQLYRMHQKGAYVGREAEWNRQDADIIAAGREGRIR
jgi:hypothetical protein